MIWKVTSQVCIYTIFSPQPLSRWQDRTPALRCEARVGRTVVPEIEESRWLNGSPSSAQDQHGKRECIGRRLLGHSRYSGYQRQTEGGGHTQE